MQDIEHMQIWNWQSGIVRATLHTLSDCAMLNSISAQTNKILICHEIRMETMRCRRLRSLPDHLIAIVDTTHVWGNSIHAMWNLSPVIDYWTMEIVYLGWLLLVLTSSGLVWLLCFALGGKNCALHHHVGAILSRKSWSHVLRLKLFCLYSSSCVRSMLSELALEVGFMWRSRITFVMRIRWPSPIL